MVLRKEVLVIFLIVFLFVLIFNQKIKNLFSFSKEEFFKTLKFAGFFPFENKEEQKNKTKRNEVVSLQEKISNDLGKKNEINENEEEKEISFQKEDDILNESIEIIEKEEEKEEKIKKEEIFWCQYSISSFPKREVIFNEIAWMGTEESSFGEWVELRNISDKEIDLTGWQLQNQKGKIKVVLKGNLLPKDFYLLERTSDDTLPDIKADLIFSGSILNQDEALYLFDRDCNLQDVVFADPDWPAGISQKGEKRTAERMKDLSWRSSAILGGTPKKENTEGLLIVLKTEKSSGGTVSEDLKDFLKIYISEVKISPLQERYIEIFNPNDFEVDLTGYYLQRKVGEGNFPSFISSSFFEGKKIGPKSFLLIVRDKTKFSQFQEGKDIEKKDLTLTQDNALQLKNSKGTIVDTFSWQKISEQNSFGRKWSEKENNLILDELEEQIPTPKEKNQSLPPYVSLEIPQNINFFISLSQEEKEPYQEILISNKGNTSTSWFLKEEDENPLFSFSSKEGNLDRKSSTIIKVSFLTNDLKPDVYEKEASFFYLKPDGTEEKINLKLKGIITKNDVALNEIAWAGTIASAFDEWIELKNNTTSTISLNGWKILGFKKGATTSSLTISLSREILPQDFFLLERSDDQSILDVSADLTFKGAIIDGGMRFELRDENDNLVDFFDFSEGWGEATQKNSVSGKKIPISLERVDPRLPGALKENWKYNNLLVRNGKDAGKNEIFGTPKFENSVFIERKITIISESNQLRKPLEIFGEIKISKDFSPYLISSQQFVPFGTTLILEKGINVYFDENSLLEIQGVLRTEPEEDLENYVVFSPYEKGNFFSLFFNQSKGSFVGNLKIFQGGIFSKEDSLFLGAIEIQESEINFKNLEIPNAFPYGIKMKNATTSIENLKIENVKDLDDFQSAGILLLKEDENENSFLSIKNSLFSDNTRSFFISLPLSETSQRIAIFQDTIFKNNDFAIFVETDTCQKVKEVVILENVSFLNNQNNFFVPDDQECWE